MGAGAWWTTSGGLKLKTTAESDQDRFIEVTGTNNQSFVVPGEAVSYSFHFTFDPGNELERQVGRGALLLNLDRSELNVERIWSDGSKDTEQIGGFGWANPPLFESGIGTEGVAFFRVSDSGQPCLPVIGSAIVDTCPPGGGKTLKEIKLVAQLQGLVIPAPRPDCPLINPGLPHRRCRQFPSDQVERTVLMSKVLDSDEVKPVSAKQLVSIVRASPDSPSGQRPLDQRVAVELASPNTNCGPVAGSAIGRNCPLGGSSPNTNCGPVAGSAIQRNCPPGGTTFPPADAASQLEITLLRRDLNRSVNGNGIAFLAFPEPGEYFQSLATQTSYNQATGEIIATPSRPLTPAMDYYGLIAPKPNSAVGISGERLTGVVGFETVRQGQSSFEVRAEPSEIVAGESAALSWSGRDLTEVAIKGSGIAGRLTRALPPEGRHAVSPRETSSYLVAAYGQDGRRFEETIQVAVQPRLPAPPPSPSEPAPTKQKPKKPIINKIEITSGGLVSASAPLKLHGVADPGSEVRITIESQAIVLTTRADGEGNWSVEYGGPIEPGSHKVTVVSVLDDQVSESSDEATFSVATPTSAPRSPAPVAAQSSASSPPSLTPPQTKPAPKIAKTRGKAKQAQPESAAPQPPPSTAVGELAPALPPISSGTPPTVSLPQAKKGKIIRRGRRPLKITGKASPRRRVKVIIRSDEPIEVEVETDDQGNWSYELPTALESGSHTLTAVEIDDQGNESAPTEVNFQVEEPATANLIISGGLISLGVIVMVIGLVL